MEPPCPETPRHVEKKREDFSLETPHVEKCYSDLPNVSEVSEQGGSETERIETEVPDIPFDGLVVTDDETAKRLGEELGI